MDLPAPVQTCLEQHHVLHLTTNRVHSVPLFYAVLPAGLIWISDPASEHSLDLTAAPDAAASVAPSAPPLDRFSGVQLRGQVDLATEQAPLRQAYLARFPKAGGLVAAAPGHRFYLLRPQWVRLIERQNHQIQRREWPAQ